MANFSQKTSHESNTSRPIEILNTSKDNIICYIPDITIDDIYKNEIKDTVVIAKDDKGMYVTSKSFAGTHLLDPYKLYNRVEVIEKDGIYSFKTFLIPVDKYSK